MKFVTAVLGSSPFVGLIDSKEDKILLLSEAEKAIKGQATLPNTMIECIKMGEKFIQLVTEIKEGITNIPNKETFFVSTKDVKLLAPIPRPEKNIFCIGKNYAEHAIEMGSKDDIPEHLIVFTKAPTTVIGPNEKIYHHKEVTNELDYEGELAVVIGKKGKNIPKEEALNYVFGYTIINDVTARDLQSRHKQYFLGKSLDTTCPMGPWIVHAASIQNPNQLHVETRINGEIRQQSNTKHFIFPVEEIISVLSQGMTLEPGDIIATGTPSGVGKGFKPPKFLNQGDEIEITIEQIGTLCNQITDD